MKLKPKRLVAWGLGLLVVFLLILALRPNPVPADFAVVERGALRVSIHEEGETRVRDRFVVSAPLAGQVLRIGLEPGDPVQERKTILATFMPSDPTPLDVRNRATTEARIKAAQAALGQARANRERAEAQLAFARAQFERSRRLAQQGIVSKDQLEKAELDVRTKEEELRADEFALRNASHELEVARTSLIQTNEEDAGRSGKRRSRRPIVLHSPVDGVILRRLRESQAVVPAGEPLLELGDPTDLEIVTDLLSTDAVHVRPGNQVLIEQWGGGTPLHGQVRRVEPSGFTKISALGVEEQRVNVIVDFKDPHQAWEALGDGYRVEVRIIIWERDEVLKVPTSSLFRHGGNWAVFTVQDEKAMRRLVEIGQQNGLEGEVLSGLSEGDRVIIHPSDDISEGVAIALRSS